MNPDITQLTKDVLEGVRVYLTDPLFDADAAEEEKSPYSAPLVLPGGKRYAMAVRHECRMNPPGFSIKDVIPADLQLPADVEHFYTQIPEAALDWIFTNFRLRLPGLLDKDAGPEEWIETKPPFHLLRFCELSFLDMCYALRTKNNGKSWDVVYIAVGDSDQEAAESFPTLHESFTDWLQYLTDNDGWPPLKSSPGAYGLYRHFERRIPDEEAKAVFGPLSALLPAPERSCLEFEPGQLDLLRARWLRKL